MAVSRRQVFHLVSGFTALAAQQTIMSASLKPAVPREPIAAILDAARHTKVIAFGESHGNRATHAFLRSVVRDCRFADGRLRSAC
jgi:hypothetical protein